jgi:predicted methyltransferase
MQRSPVVIAIPFLFAFAAVASCGGAPANGPTSLSPAASGTPGASVAAPTPTSAGSKGATTSEAAQAIVNAPDRSRSDRELDAGRKPAQLLEFFRVAPGMQVAELAAATGYTTELLARAIGPTGKVYGQNPKWVLEQYAEKWWSNRLTKPMMTNVVRVDREFEDPLPAEAHDLDAVFCVLFYHDFFWLNVDRDKVNRAVFRALKSGGTYAIVDHSARAGTGGTEAKTLHRVEEKTVRTEIEKAGFRLRAEATFLRNPNDARDWNAAPETPEEAAKRRGTSDRFVLAFEKP